MLKTVKLSLLYDFYEQLLTDRQKKVFELYYSDDLSLGEIAENLKITRQGVYDNLKKTEKLLYKYENKLQLVEKFFFRKEQIKRIKNELVKYRNATKDKEDKSFLDNIENIIDELSNH